MTSYLSENEAKNLQNGDIHLAQIPDFEWDISRTIWRIEVNDGSFFFHFSRSFIRAKVFSAKVLFKVPGSLKVLGSLKVPYRAYERPPSRA